jgi:hypothetical protein
MARHLSYATVVSTVSLILALGGASYAAIAIPANSVHPRQLSFPVGLRTADGGPAILRAQGGFGFKPSPQVLTRMTVRLKHATKLLIMGSAVFQVTPPDAPASAAEQVDLGTATRNGSVLHTDVLHGSEALTASFWQVETLPAGRQVIRLVAAVIGPSEDVHVGGAQLAVMALPALP